MRLWLINVQKSCLKVSNTADLLMINFGGDFSLNIWYHVNMLCGVSLYMKRFLRNNGRFNTFRKENYLFR